MPLGAQEQKKLLQFFHELMATRQDFRLHTLEGLKRIFGYDNATFWLGEGKNLYEPLTLQVPDRIMREYLNYWRHDPFHPQNLPPAATKKNTLSLRSVTTQQNYEKNPYYTEILRPHRFTHKAVLFYKDNQRIIGASSILRTESEREFTPQDFEIFHHIAQAVGNLLTQHLLRKNIAAERDFFQMIAEDTGDGIFLFDEFFQITYGNSKAAAYCRECQNTPNPDSPSRCLLRALALHKSDLWRGGFARQIVSPVGNGYKIEVHPLILQREKLWYCRLTPSREPQKNSALSISRQQHFHITPREYEIAALVCRGLSNQEIALQLFISLATVKTHLQTLYQKLQISSRTQLILAMKSIE